MEKGGTRFRLRRKFARRRLSARKLSAYRLILKCCAASRETLPQRSGRSRRCLSGRIGEEYCKPHFARKEPRSVQLSSLVVNAPALTFWRPPSVIGLPVPGVRRWLGRLLSDRRSNPVLPIGTRRRTQRPRRSACVMEQNAEFAKWPPGAAYPILRSSRWSEVLRVGD